MQLQRWKWSSIYAIVNDENSLHVIKTIHILESSKLANLFIKTSFKLTDHNT